MWATSGKFLFCRRMYCRYAALAFKVFSVHENCADAILFEADKCPSLSFPSHGGVYWRSERRTTLHLPHGEMWIDFDYEGNDHIPR